VSALDPSQGAVVPAPLRNPAWPSIPKETAEIHSRRGCRALCTPAVPSLAFSLFWFSRGCYTLWWERNWRLRMTLSHLLAAPNYLLLILLIGILCQAVPPGAILAADLLKW